MGKFGGEVRVVEFPVCFFLVYVSTDLISFFFFVFAVPPLGAFSYPLEDSQPGRMIVVAGEIIINKGRRAVMLTVSNRADRPIQVHNL